MAQEEISKKLETRAMLSVGRIHLATGSALVIEGKPLLLPEVEAGIVSALLLTTVAGPMGLGWILRRSASES